MIGTVALVRFITGVFAAAMLCTSPAIAKPGDNAWAACVWQTAPASAAKWIAMTPPDYHVSFESAESLLGLRLSALCGTVAANERKGESFYDFKRFASTLKGVRPKTSAGSDQADVVVELCRYRLNSDGKVFTYRYDVVRIDAAVRTTTYIQYYDEIEGKPVRLPQSLRIVPKPEQSVEKTCAPISSDGTLTNA
ncbi:hypothetical protein [uncultured Sphingomonas sp.]|uniref:hypothetical protein n=1 Tax=uncultured Sphingomonas sp. TaxID=158754 RepID=UPI002602D2D2|nr:hypothetical protein [uncultured Sphingomonas sp.]